MSFCSVYLNMCLKQSIHPAKTAQCSVSRPVPDSLPSPACPHLFLFPCVFVSVSHRHCWRANNTQFECVWLTHVLSALSHELAEQLPAHIQGCCVALWSMLQLLFPLSFQLESWAMFEVVFETIQYTLLSYYCVTLQGTKNKGTV